MPERIQSLNGTWQIARDPENKGKTLEWYKKAVSPEKEYAKVPGIMQEVYPYYDGPVWYYLGFYDKTENINGCRKLLRFAGVDYMCEVWLNGCLLGSHENSEEPFEYDVTGCIQHAESNFIALRIVVPYEVPVDGLTIETIACRNKMNLGYTPGSSINAGGIICPVSLVSEEPVRFTDIYVKPYWLTGSIEIEAALKNDTGSEINCSLFYNISEVRGGSTVKAGQAAVFAPKGESSVRCIIKLDEFRLWSCDDPFLYSVLFTLTQDGKSMSEGSAKTIRFGFRNFSVKNGFFMLNGKRIFLRSSHTGNNMPVGIVMSRDTDMVMKDIHYAKALGINTLRFIAGMPLAEQLDTCDEMGMMVYEESYAGWLLGESPYMKKRFADSISNMVKRDRNHPCVVIWGLLNETSDGELINTAINYLPEFRKMEPTRLILLNSGRFDRRPEIGSVSNPFSDEWQYEWGFENSEGMEKVPEMGDLSDVGPYPRGLGDVHMYPRIPHSERAVSFMRTVGFGSKPVFVSEYGIGSQNNVIREYLKFRENHLRIDLEDSAFYGKMAGSLRKDWNYYGFDGVYIFPEDFLNDSMRINAAQRRMCFDIIRSNPMICGYNLTGLLDHALTGEGLWTYWREFKPGMADALKESFAPLKWALFTEKRCVYAGKPFMLEAVICNEDVLEPGEYPALFRIKGDKGIVWEKSCSIKLPEKGYGDMPPLAVSVINEYAEINEPGEYEFGAALTEDGAPSGGRLKFTVMDPDEGFEGNYEVSELGCSGESLKVLASCGTKIMDFRTGGLPENRLLLIGKTGENEKTPELWRRIYKFASDGGNVVFLDPDMIGRNNADPDIWKKGPETTEYLPFIQKGECSGYWNWLYHLDNIHKNHPVFDGIHKEGIVEYEYFDSIYPVKIYEGIEKPSKTVCAAIGVGQTRKEGYVSGLTFGEYNYGKGRIILNTFRIIESVGHNPIADRMLFNIVKHYSRDSKE